MPRQAGTEYSAYKGTELHNTQQPLRHGFDVHSRPGNRPSLLNLYHCTESQNVRDSSALKFLQGILFLLGVLAAMPCNAQTSRDLAPRGNLIIVGGGDTPLIVQERFVALAGGPGKARIAVFPMASTKYDEEAHEVVDDFESLGAEVFVFTFDRSKADGEALSLVLESFTGYWFLGGDQSRLAEALLGTRALRTIERGYQGGKVIGGTSAGAAVMTTAMLTGKKRRQEKNPVSDEITIARKIFETSRGFGFLSGAIIDQHFLKRARYNRLLSAVLDQPHLIGVGIDEETAILVRPEGHWEVLGASYVKIFDARLAELTDKESRIDGASGIKLHLLPGGGEFDPKTGQAKLPGKYDIPPELSNSFD